MQLHKCAKYLEFKVLGINCDAGLKGIAGAAFSGLKPAQLLFPRTGTCLVRWHQQQQKKQRLPENLPPDLERVTPSACGSCVRMSFTILQIQGGDNQAVLVLRSLLCCCELLLHTIYNCLTAKEISRSASWRMEKSLPSPLVRLIMFSENVGKTFLPSCVPSVSPPFYLSFFADTFYPS